MDATWRTRVGEILTEALARSDDARDEYVREACGGDSEVEAEVRALLADALGALRLLDKGAREARAGERPGAVIGRYTLLDQIGEGGFGAVFLAEQREPVQRRVALKVIKLGMDTRQVIARFEAERQALALMDHPNIATVLDAGATAAGRPYFVMELVKGNPITEYCDTSSLDVPQRLELFGRVCSAVQHAHQKGIIHRDLKPHNVLVTEVDGRPVPKVIDFGIAKATSGRLTEKTLLTEHRALIGTPAYMSPEQAGMGGVDIDTRSDVYSLGVLLYELLTGTTPFDPGELRRAEFGEVQHIIREVEPPKPSTRLAARKDTLASVAAQRRSEPARLPGLIRGDLDWIVMKCLEKDRARRYETVNGLALDVQRHLAGEPVAAAPPARGYRLRKLVRRHRGPVAAGTLVLLALAGGLAATLIQAREARWQAERADERARAAKRAEAEQRRLLASESAARTEAQNQRAEAQAQKAAAEKAALAEKQRADELKQVSDFQAQMLAQVDPAEAGEELTRDVLVKLAAALVELPEVERAGEMEAFTQQWRKVNATDAARDLIDRTILMPATQAIDAQFKSQPVVDAQLRQVLADRYCNLALYDAAMPLQASALELRRHVLGEEHPDTLESIKQMGSLLYEQDRLAEAEPYLREALEKCRRVLGEEHRQTIRISSNLGSLLQAQGKLDQAESYFREALEKCRSVLGEEDPETIRSINNVASLLWEQGKPVQAEPYQREALEKCRRVLGEEHPLTLTSINSMARLLGSQGKLAEAEPYVREALEKNRRLQGEEHPDTLSALNNMAGLLCGQGKLPEAEPYLREALEKSRRVLGEEHRQTIAICTNLGFVLQARKMPDEAEPFTREALEKCRHVLGNEHPDTILALDKMGTLLQEQGKLAEAETYMREALETSRRQLGKGHPMTLRSINNLGCLLRDQGKLDEAETTMREAVETARALGQDNLSALIGIDHLGALLRRQGRLAEAEPFLSEELEIRRRLQGDEHPETLKAVHDLGALFLAADKLTESEALLLPGAALAEAKLSPSDTILRELTLAVAELYETWEAADPGKGYAAQASKWRAKASADAEGSAGKP